jgi:hypothetical protein
VQPKGLLKFLRLEGFVQNIIEYAENRIAITKLEIKSQIGDVVRSLMIYLPIALLGLFALIFLSITLAQALNVWLDSRVWGFLIVSVVYIVLCAVLFSLRNSEALKKKIVDGSTSFLKEKPDDGKKDSQEDSPAIGYAPEAVEHKKFIFEEPVAEQTAEEKEDEELIVIDNREEVRAEKKGNEQYPPSREPMPNPELGSTRSTSASARKDQQS